ncbi:SDR family oxidoreductase [Saccharopolyspora shandongensis]|uniref:SDR family NAD(P)-dependent oxidoreductase n=1 Tax=Saccharopolyspora shandongensis TaxID=418495 RepID=UPI00340C88CB
MVVTGAAIATGLAAEGAMVVAADQNLAGAEEIAASIREAGQNAVATGVDVRERDQMHDLAERAVTEFGRLDVWFNNAGVAMARPFLDVTAEDWHQTQSVNGLGTLLGCQEAARMMIRRSHGGKIINTASIAGRQGFARLAAYSASKFGVVALTQAAARALAEHRITVNAFAPGLVRTPMLDAIQDARPERAQPEFGGPLLGRESTPADILPTAVFLASSDSDYLTGQVLPVESGIAADAFVDSKVVPSGSSTGVICLTNRPSPLASAARRWDSVNCWTAARYSSNSMSRMFESIMITAPGTWK